MTAPFKLHPGLLLGTATAATQIEGGDQNNSWHDWCVRGKIKDGTGCLRADDHWNRWREDIDLMASMGLQIYRMGLEWSRIEPENGVFDEAAVAHYREELAYLLSKGIRPLVTLHHFTNPMWFEKIGAFEHRSCVRYFARFVKYAVERLGDLCSDWITINEPNVYATEGYHFGDWPPGKKSFPLAMRVLRNLALCHAEAYRVVHAVRTERGFSGATMVGFANHLRIFTPMRAGSPADRVSARLMEYLFQGAITKSMFTGRFPLPLGLGLVRHGKGSGTGPGLLSDFIGINYYTRSAVTGFADHTMPDTPRNDLGWELYPAGLGILCKKLHEKYRLPVWITENGTCDCKDAFRARYIYDHLREIHDLPYVERYYHWTFMDNFEWLEGESACFGLVAVDYATQARTIRGSGHFYGEIIREGGVTEDMIEKYSI